MNNPWLWNPSMKVNILPDADEFVAWYCSQLRPVQRPKAVWCEFKRGNRCMQKRITGTLTYCELRYGASEGFNSASEGFSTC